MKASQVSFLICWILLFSCYSITSSTKAFPSQFSTAQKPNEGTDHWSISFRDAGTHPPFDIYLQDSKYITGNSHSPKASCPWSTLHKCQACLLDLATRPSQFGPISSDASKTFYFGSINSSLHNFQVYANSNIVSVSAQLLVNGWYAWGMLETIDIPMCA